MALRVREIPPQGYSQTADSRMENQSPRGENIEPNIQLVRISVLLGADDGEGRNGIRTIVTEISDKLY